MGYNLLLVDDSSATLHIISKIIGISGVPIAQVYTAKNGVEALAVAAQHALDLIITDLNMPEMNGLELIEHLKQSPELAKIPIIVVSTEGRDVWVDKAFALGVAHFIRKPFLPENIRDVIYQALGASHAQTHQTTTETSDF